VDINSEVVKFLLFGKFLKDVVVEFSKFFDNVFVGDLSRYVSTWKTSLYIIDHLMLKIWKSILQIVYIDLLFFKNVNDSRKFIDLVKRKSSADITYMFRNQYYGSVVGIRFRKSLFGSELVYGDFDNYFDNFLFIVNDFQPFSHGEKLCLELNIEGDVVIYKFIDCPEDLKNYHETLVKRLKILKYIYMSLPVEVVEKFVIDEFQLVEKLLKNVEYTYSVNTVGNMKVTFHRFGKEFEKLLNYIDFIRYSNYLANFRMLPQTIFIEKEFTVQSITLIYKYGRLVLSLKILNNMFNINN